MRENIKTLLVRSERAWAWKRQHYGQWVECWRYAAPGVNPFYSMGGSILDSGGGGGRNRYQGGSRNDHLFDSTMARAADKHANTLVSTLFPAGQDWAELSRGPIFKGDSESSDTRIQQALASAQTKMFQAIHASNFVLAVNSMVRDGVVSGTGTMKVGVSADSSTLLDFEAVNQTEVGLERGTGDQIWAFFRKMHVRTSHIPVLWPDATNIPASRPESEHEEDEHYIQEITYYDPMDAIWRYEVVLVGDQEGTEPVSMYSREYIVPPWIVYRYSLEPGAVHGYSPVSLTLPDARTANHATRVRLENASMRVGGMWMYNSQDAFNPANVRMGSGRFLAVRSTSRDAPTIRPMELPGDPQMGEIVLADHRMEIKEGLMDIGLPDPAGSVRSATEIIERQREAQQRLGMPYKRLIEEVGRPVLRAVAYLLEEVGQLPELAALKAPLPNGRPAPLMLDGRDVKVMFTSPLVTAQRLTDAETTIRAFDILKGLFGLPLVAANLRVQDAPALIYEKLGGPEQLVRDPEDREERSQAVIEGGGLEGGGPMPMGGAPMGAAA